MARTAGRSAGDTKRQILDAAAQLFGKHGTAASLDDIAKAAGVSKGGLVYHFPSKEALLTSLAMDLMNQFRNEVEEAAAAEPEGTPGRLTRAYIRVSFADVADDIGLRDYIALAVNLMLEPALLELSREDAVAWREDLLADGLDESVIRMVVAATDGSYAAPLWGAVLSDADRHALEADLLALTQQ